MPEHALDDEGEPERQQQAVEMIEPVEPLQKHPLDHNAGGADDDRRQHQRLPVADVKIIEQQERRERAHHVLGAVSEIDDVEHSEDDRKPEAQQGIERAVDQADQELAEQCRRRNAEDFEHEGPFVIPPRLRRGWPSEASPGGAHRHCVSGATELPPCPLSPPGAFGATLPEDGAGEARLTPAPAGSRLPVAAGTLPRRESWRGACIRRPDTWILAASSPLTNKPRG